MTDANSKQLTITVSIEVSEDFLKSNATELKTIFASLRDIGRGSLVSENAEQSAKPATLLSSDELKRRAEISEHFEQRKQRFHKDAVQACRLYRRIRPIYDTEHECLQVIAGRFDWPVTVVPEFLRLRRDKVRAYIKRRRIKSALKMRAEGKTYKEIADVFGLTASYVGNLVRKANANQSIPQVNSVEQTEGAVK